MKKSVKSMVDDAMDVTTTYSVDDARELWDLSRFPI